MGQLKHLSSGDQGSGWSHRQAGALRPSEGNYFIVAQLAGTDSKGVHPRSPAVGGDATGHHITDPPGQFRRHLHDFRLAPADGRDLWETIQPELGRSLVTPVGASRGDRFSRTAFPGCGASMPPCGHWEIPFAAQRGNQGLFSLFLRNRRGSMELHVKTQGDPDPAAAPFQTLIP